MANLATERVAEPRITPNVRSDRLAGIAYITYTIVAALTLVALALRLHDLARESLWLDEGYTLLFSHLPFPQLIVVGGAHEHPPLYYVIDHVLYGLKDSYLVPRVVSAVAGTLSVPALYALGTRLYGRLPGLVAALLLAVSPFHLWYSQDGRAYELAGLFVILSYLTLFSSLEDRRRGLWIAYAVATALCLYTEYTTAFALLPQALLFFRAGSGANKRGLVRAWIAVAVLFAPWIGTLTLDTASIAGRYWIPPPTWESVVNTVLQFLGMRTPCPSPPCAGAQIGVPLLAGHEGVVTIAAVAIAALILILAVWRRRIATVVISLWLIAPFACVLLLAARRPLYLDRIFLDVTFPLYLLLGAGVTAAGRRVGRDVLGAIPAAVVLASSVLGVQIVSATTTNPDWRPLAHDLALAYRPGQAVLFVPGVVRSIAGAYLPPDWRASRESLMWYHAYLDVPGWTQRYAGATDDQLRDIQMRALTRGERQVWLVTMDYTGTADTRTWFLTHGYHLLLSEIYSGDTRLELWDRGVPRDVGPTALPDTGFTGWTRSGPVVVNRGVAREEGRASLSRTFPIRAGRAYSVNVEWRSIPPAYPQIQVQTYDHAGHIVGIMRDRFGYLQNTFPRTRWYSLPATGVWLSQPFGFVAPPGATLATIRVANLWGETSWRHIAVYGERRYG